MYTADNICKMIEFLIDNIFVQVGGCLFRQVIRIPMGTTCAPLHADLFIYLYEKEFLDNMIRSGHRLFNLCYHISMSWDQVEYKVILFYLLPCNKFI